MDGAGQDIPMKGLPGRVVAPNISPDPNTGAGNWTDDQLARAIREGVGYDGQALFPLMPYQRFRSLSDEDWPPSSCTFARCRRYASNSPPPSSLSPCAI